MFSELHRVEEGFDVNGALFITWTACKAVPVIPIRPIKKKLHGEFYVSHLIKNKCS